MTKLYDFHAYLLFVSYVHAHTHEPNSLCMVSLYIAIGTIGPQAKGVGNDKLIGQYLQLSILFYVLFAIPIAILWIARTKDVILWFGFDEDTAHIGQLYAIPFNLYNMLTGVDACIREWLNFDGHEYYSLGCGVVQCIIHLITFIGLGSKGSALHIDDLAVIGYVQFSLEVVFLVGKYYFIIEFGWLDRYWDGLIDTSAFKVRCHTQCDNPGGSIHTYFVGRFDFIFLLTTFFFFSLIFILKPHFDNERMTRR